MTDYRKQSAHECPETDYPADQPKPPGGSCADLPTNKPPEPPKPTPCKEPPKSCKCPLKPPENANCLEIAIKEAAENITIAERGKAFKAELEALLAKAKAAAQDYTQAKYEDLLKKWQEEDRDISDFIRKVVCSVPCWRCVIECYVCPLLNELHYAEAKLYGDGTQYTDVHNLYDLRYWFDRDREGKERTLQRVKDVLAAWEKPAQTIEKILADNAKLLADSRAALGTNPSKVVYDVFLRLIPMHLAIAPPNAGPETQTWIDKKYTDFCGCDFGTPDDCCGPDVGPQSLRQRLIGPQPYLVNPADYFKIICCLVDKRYKPAKRAAAEAEAGFQSVDSDITRLKAQIINGLKTFDKDAKAAIPSVIDDCGCDPDETDSKSGTRR